MLDERIGRELLRRGYRVNERPYAILDACDEWYRAKETQMHRRMTVGGTRYSLLRMGFGRRLAADDANLCEVVEVNPGEEGFDFLARVLENNGFESGYRRQLELCSAEGTAACYVWMDKARCGEKGELSGGEIRLQFVEARQYIPLTVEGDRVVEAAFFGREEVGAGEVLSLLLCLCDGEGRYRYETMAWDEHGEVKSRRACILLGHVCPFAVLRTADVNTIEGMRGFGYPKLYGAIPLLYGLDSAYTALVGDIETAEKITLINELLCRFDGQGNAITPNEQMKRRFVLLGEKLPEQEELVHEITPKVRIEEFRKTIDLLLSLLTRQYGFGSKKYTIDADGRLLTATQYVGERHEMLQELNRQRFEAKRYIAQLVHAIFWFANAFFGTGFAADCPVEVEFDDSYITDRSAQLEGMRRDVLDGIGGAFVRRAYLQKRYNLTEAEAELWAQEGGSENGDAGDA